MGKINPLALSIIGGLFIFFTTYVLFWVLFLCLDSPNASQTAINILGNYFGGIAALWTAVIAAYLFSDWRVVKQYEIILNYVMLIKTNVRDLQGYINSIRASYVLDIANLKSPTLNNLSYQEIAYSINDREREIVSMLSNIARDANELYYLKHQKPTDPIVEQLIIKIAQWQNLGITQENYYKVYTDRQSDNTLQEYYDYLINDLINFVYNEIFTQYLDELILEKSKTKH